MSRDDPPKRGRPPKVDPFDATIRIRLFSNDKDVIERAAGSAAALRGGGTLSEWIRAVLLKAARKELGESAVD